jgi:glycosyltransferase involved in cell wall biosynthesis
MKISIIIPSQNNTEYLSKLLIYLKANISEYQLEEIIIVNDFEDKQFKKLAEKSHAKLYVFKDSNHKLKAEAGAFEAKGEILYFIKPGHFPPKDFAERIIAAVKLKYELGSLYHPLVGRICRFCNWVWMDRLVIFFSPMHNFFILKKTFLCYGGLRYDGQTSSFSKFLKKKEFRLTSGLIQ